MDTLFSKRINTYGSSLLLLSTSKKDDLFHSLACLQDFIGHTSFSLLTAASPRILLHGGFLPKGLRTAHLLTILDNLQL